MVGLGVRDNVADGLEICEDDDIGERTINSVGSRTIMRQIK